MIKRDGKKETKLFKLPIEVYDEVGRNLNDYNTGKVKILELKVDDVKCRRN